MMYTMMEAAKEDPVIVFSADCHHPIITDCHHPIIIRAKEPDVQPRTKWFYSRHANGNQKVEHKQRLELWKRVLIVCMHIDTIIFYDETTILLIQVLTIANLKEKRIKLWLIWLIFCCFVVLISIIIMQYISLVNFCLSLNNHHLSFLDFVMLNHAVNFDRYSSLFFSNQINSGWSVT